MSLLVLPIVPDKEKFIINFIEDWILPLNDGFIVDGFTAIYILNVVHLALIVPTALDFGPNICHKTMKMMIYD